MNERLPSLPLPTPALQAYSSGTASPRVSSIASSTSSNADSQSSYTSVASSNGPKTPPSSLPVSGISSGPLVSSGLHTPLVQPNISGYDQYQAMNQGAAEMYYQQSHIPGGQPPQSQPVTSGALQYNPHQQPPILQPGPAQYANPSPYGQYGYPNGLTSPPAAPPSISHSIGANTHVLPLPGVATQQGMQANYSGFDTTGQIAPPGMKPRVTATLWEDEGSLCFQVEARGICVARREDNHMINGTKLLNVAGMTRGRRDGILKSEKVRHVVKIGPMHLKGVWIPFDRALDFANKEKITELLFPLFVHNIAALLYHPTNQSRTNQVMAAAERRKQEQNQMRNGQQPGLPSLQHHSTMGLPGPQPTLPSHNIGTPGRPQLDRAHTFPTPPTSASSVMGGGMSSSDQFWPSQQSVNGAQATTPPGPPLQTMQPYPPSTQSYDNSRSIYNTQMTSTQHHQQQHHQPPPSQQQQQTPQPQHAQQPQTYALTAPSSSPQERTIYSHNAAAAAAAAAGGYVKNEMPQSNRSSVTGPPGSEQVDQKPPNGLIQHHGEQTAESVAHTVGEEEHEHEAEYTHNSGTYDASRAQYNYAAPQATSGRSTPRSAAAPQAYYAQQGYSTPPPPRVGSTAAATQASSSLYNVVTNDRASTNGTSTSDVYAPAADMGGSLQNGYANPIMNGASAGMKRGRDDDDDRSMELKRRKTLLDSSMPPVYDASAMNRAPAIATQQRHR